MTLSMSRDEWTDPFIAYLSIFTTAHVTFQTSLFENSFIGYENINLLLVCPVKSHNRVGLARASKLFLFWGRVGKKMKNDNF